jgi:predicted O-methyltransferase YrrM
VSSLAAEPLESIELSDERVRELTLQVLLELSTRTQEVERGLTILLQEFSQLRADVAGPVRAQLQSLRQDLSFAADLAAAASSAQFAQEHFPTARALPDARSTLRYGLSKVAAPGMALEFGVATGSTLRIIAEHLSDRDVYGFDVFSGLPKDWRTGFEAGAFAQAPPQVEGAEMVVGLFEDTLPSFLATHAGPVSFVHADADLYSSTVTIFDHIGPRLVEGSIVVFDEYFNYPSWAEHEHKAWTEFVGRTGIEFEYLGYTVNHEQLALRITGRP